MAPMPKAGLIVSTKTLRQWLDLRDPTDAGKPELRCKTAALVLADGSRKRVDRPGCCGGVGLVGRRSGERLSSRCSDRLFGAARDWCTLLASRVAPNRRRFRGDGLLASKASGGRAVVLGPPCLRNCDDVVRVATLGVDRVTNCRRCADCLGRSRVRELLQNSAPTFRQLGGLQTTPNGARFSTRAYG